MLFLRWGDFSFFSHQVYDGHFLKNEHSKWKGDRGNNSHFLECTPPPPFSENSKSQLINLIYQSPNAPSKKKKIRRGEFGIKKKK